MWADTLLIVFISICTAFLGEGLTWLMVYRTERYQKLKTEVERQSKKSVSETWLSEQTPDEVVNIDGYSLVRRDRNLGRGGGVLLYIRNSIKFSVVDDNRLEKRKEIHGDTLDKQQKKKIEREEDKLKHNNRDLSFVKMKSMFAIGFAFTALLSMFNSIFDGKVVAKLPFLPLTWIQGLSHRNLAGDNYYDCSFIFLYILCTMSIRQNIQKLLGFAPSRAASKQSNSLFGTAPGQFK